MRIKFSKVKLCKDCKRSFKLYKMPFFCMKNLIEIKENNHCKYFKRRIIKLDKLVKSILNLK